MKYSRAPSLNRNHIALVGDIIRYMNNVVKTGWLEVSDTWRKVRGRRRVVD